MAPKQRQSRPRVIHIPRPMITFEIYDLAPAQEPGPVIIDPRRLPYPTDWDGGEPRKVPA